MKFGDNIKKLREENDVKQRELAKFLEITTATLSRYESNKSIPGDLMMLVKIANYFNVSVDYLIGATDTIQKELNKSEKQVIERLRELPSRTRFEITDFLNYKYLRRGVFEKDE